MKKRQTYIEEFANSLKKSGKLRATIESYCRDARIFSVYLEKHSIALDKTLPETLVEYKKYLEEQGETRNTVRRATIGIRQYFRFLTRSRVISESPFEHVSIPDRKEDLPPQLSTERVSQLISKALNNSSMIQAKRNALILSLLAYEGLKTNEIIEMTPSSVLHGSKATSLHVPGPRARTIVLSEVTSKILREYETSLEKFKSSKKLTKQSLNFLFSFKGKEQATIIPKMSRHGIKFILYEIGESTGIEKLNSEQLRHHALNHMLSNGLSPEQIMNHTGLRRIGNIAKHIKNSH